MKNITRDELRRMKGSEGLILQGCGGDLGEWVDGINEMLTDEGILLDSDTFKDVAVFENDGCTNLLFNMDNVKLDIGRLAMWRLRSHSAFSGCWLSDYVPNHLGGFIEAPQEYSGIDTQTTWYFPLEIKMLADENRDEMFGYDDFDAVAPRNAVWYMDEIMGQIKKENSFFDTPRKLAEYIRDDLLKSKVYSMTPTVEEHSGRIWGAMVLQLSGELTPQDVVDLKDYISGQNSDGFGEGLEQRGIRVGGGELYVSFWHSHDDYGIYTQEEFASTEVHEQIEAHTQRKPSCPIIGADGNVFNVLGIASRTLKQNGMADAAKEMHARVTESGSYDKALAIIMEYVTPVEAGGHQQGGMAMRM